MLITSCLGFTLYHTNVICQYPFNSPPYQNISYKNCQFVKWTESSQTRELDITPKFLRVISLVSIGSVTRKKGLNWKKISSHIITPIRYANWCPGCNYFRLSKWIYQQFSNCHYQLQTNYNNMVAQNRTSQWY